MPSRKSQVTMKLRSIFKRHKTNICRQVRMSVNTLCADNYFVFYVVYHPLFDPAKTVIEETVFVLGTTNRFSTELPKWNPAYTLLEVFRYKNNPLTLEATQGGKDCSEL